MIFLAHIRNDNGVRVEQPLRDHCLHTAQYAAECLSGTGLENTAYLSGILHDMGKAKQTFMNYLEAGYCGEKVVRGSVNHTFAGVIYILETYHNEDPLDCLTSEMISCAIGGHHGIFDCTDLEGNNGFLHRLQKDKNEIDYYESVHNYFENVADEQAIDKLFQKSVQEVNNLFQSINSQWDGNSSNVWFQFSMAVRLLQSSVIYGDRRDTHEFMTGKNGNSDILPNWTKERIFMDEKLKHFNSDSGINKVRTVISDQCCDFANKPGGIYRLDVPTGGGKTLSALRYALNHAEKYDKKRIIFIIPLLSVLDQNAQVIREYISDQDMILEHHSNVIRENEDGESLDLYETVMDDWHSPIIISTLVQLLNIMFKDKTSAIERMQGLCDSVIVIDEVQSLPLKTTAMFNMALDFLSQYCHATIILSSATIPRLDTIKGWPLKLADNPDMVHLNDDELSVFKRSEIIDKTTPYGMSWEECTDFCEKRIQGNCSVLIICNTKKEARTLFKLLQEIVEGDWQIFHLSTSMCQVHRVDTLRRIQDQLAIVQDDNSGTVKANKVICVSTQLVEAGVDFSFECVIRVLAGIDNLAQAAGRCNRSNEYNGLGKVYLVNLKDENLKMIADISRSQDSTREVLAGNADLEGNELIGAQAAGEYYDAMYRLAGKEIKYPFKESGNPLYMADMLSNKNEFARDRTFVLRQPFKTMGQKFKVFEDNTIDILVPYGEGKGLIEKIKNSEADDSSVIELENTLKKAGKYTISVYEYQKSKLDDNDLLISACDGRVLILSEDAYNDFYGLGDIEDSKAEK